MSTLKKPHPDAIQTVYGWALPKTGEILALSQSPSPNFNKRGLPNPVDGFKIGKPWNNYIPPVPQSQEVSTPVVESIIEPVADTVEVPVVESVEEVKPKRVIRKKVINTTDE